MTYSIDNLKFWFERKWKSELTQQDRTMIEFVDDEEVVAETEKAVQLRLISEFGSKKFWFPKSVFMDDSERQKKFEEGCQRYERALDFAKSHGVAVKNKMRLATILEKIRDAGLVYEI